MSISPAKVMVQFASAESLNPVQRPAAGPVRAAASAAEPGAPSAAPAPPAASPAQFSTDMRVDAAHQVYYEFVDASTGDVIFEIPPEALRAIGESLNVALVGNETGQSMDVKS